MKKTLLVVLALHLFMGCKKEQPDLEDPTLNVTTYQKDYNGKKVSANCTFYLFTSDKTDVVSSSTKLEAEGRDKTNISFYYYGGFNNNKSVPAGDYILAVQMNYKEPTYSWGRYSYKKITLKKGDKINAIMVFPFDYKTSFSEWAEN